MCVSCKVLARVDAHMIRSLDYKTCYVSQLALIASVLFSLIGEFSLHVHIYSTCL